MSHNNAVSIKRPLRDFEQLFFLHVPKSAGTTFIGLLDQRYMVDEICPIHHTYEQLLQTYPLDDLANFKFIRGHFPYDLIYKLPKPPRIITFIRDPISRFLSHIDMVRHSEGGLPELHNRLNEYKLEQFLAQPSHYLKFANRTTKLLCGKIHQLNITKDLLSIAKERLGTIDFVGITEEFDKSLELFCFIYDFPPITNYSVLNVNPNNEYKSYVPPKILDKIREINRADIELYNYGLEIFHQLQKNMESEISCSLENQEKNLEPERCSILFDFQRVSPGAGWHVGERHPIFGPFRWSGPGNTSSLVFQLPCESDLMIRFRILNSIESDTLENLQLLVNNTPVDLHHSKDGDSGREVFTGYISKEFIFKGYHQNEFRFIIDQTLSPSEVDPNNQDHRKLGLCFNWLQIYPV
jgi:hypothetical protein